MEFKSDIQIAQEAKPEVINKIAERLSIEEEFVENYGRYKAKIDYNLLDRYADKKNGKLSYCQQTILPKLEKFRVAFPSLYLGLQ